MPLQGDQKHSLFCSSEGLHGKKYANLTVAFQYFLSKEAKYEGAVLL